MAILGGFTRPNPGQTFRPVAPSGGFGRPPGGTWPGPEPRTPIFSPNNRGGLPGSPVRPVGGPVMPFRGPLGIRGNPAQPAQRARLIGGPARRYGAAL